MSSASLCAALRVHPPAFDQAATATPIQAGELEILVRVNILYAIE